MVKRECSALTERLIVRPPTEADRSRFVALFSDDDFMVFAGALSEREANERFDRMMAKCAELSFAKQPVVERSSGQVIGYTGVDSIDFQGHRWLEWGYRLVANARGKGYATEASSALLDVACRDNAGEVLGIIHPENEASKAVILKLGFLYWKRTRIQGDVRDLYRVDTHDRGVDQKVVVDAPIGPGTRAPRSGKP